MTVTKIEGERRNGELIGEDGLTGPERGTARKAERKAERAPGLAAIVEKHGLSRNGRGVLWTTPAVADFLWAEFQFTLLSPYVNNGAGKHGVLLFGACAKCGETSRPRWADVTQGKSSCNSTECGGSRMPPDYKMNRLFKSRGFELVGDYPTGAFERFTLRHVAADPERPGQEPCQQVVTVAWNDFANAGKGCGVCAGMQVAVGYNDFLTTHLQLAALLVNEADGLTVTGGSRTELLFHCVEHECGGTTARTPNTLTNHNVWPRCGDHGQDWLVGEHAWYLADEYWADTSQHALVLHGHSWAPQDPELAARQNLYTRLKHHRDMARKIGTVIPEFTVIMLQSNAAGRSLDAAVAREFSDHPTLTDHLGVEPWEVKNYNGHANETRMGVTAAEVYAFALEHLDGESSVIIRVPGTESEDAPDRWSHPDFDPLAIQSVPSL